MQQHPAFVDAAADAGVEHVVYTSFAGATADATFTLGRDHWATAQGRRSATGLRRRGAARGGLSVRCPNRTSTAASLDVLRHEAEAGQR